jgi:uncharacterized protein (DUF736 family)
LEAERESFGARRGDHPNGQCRSEDHPVVTRPLTITERRRNRPVTLDEALGHLADPRAALLVNERSGRAAVQIPSPSLMLGGGEIERRVRLIPPMAQQRRQNFLPLPAAPSFLARQESPSFAVEPLRGAPSIASGPSITIEAAMVRARKQRSRRTTMATIGTFKKTGSNEFTGEIVTLSVQAKNVRIVPETTRSGDNSPSHRVYVGRVEIGAAWAKRSNEGRDYLGLKLDDPSFTAPIFANLFDDEEGEGYSLIWSRPNGRRSD